MEMSFEETVDNEGGHEGGMVSGIGLREVGGARYI